MPPMPNPGSDSVHRDYTQIILQFVDRACACKINMVPKDFCEPQNITAWFVLLFDLDLYSCLISCCDLNLIKTSFPKKAEHNNKYPKFMARYMCPKSKLVLNNLVQRENRDGQGWRGQKKWLYYYSLRQRSSISSLVRKGVQ